MSKASSSQEGASAACSPAGHGESALSSSREASRRARSVVVNTPSWSPGRCVGAYLFPTKCERALLPSVTAHADLSCTQTVTSRCPWRPLDPEVYEPHSRSSRLRRFPRRPSYRRTSSCSRRPTCLHRETEYRLHNRVAVKLPFPPSPIGPPLAFQPRITRSPISNLVAWSWTACAKCLSSTTPCGTAPQALRAVPRTNHWLHGSGRRLRGWRERAQGP